MKKRKTKSTAKSSPRKPPKPFWFDPRSLSQADGPTGFENNDFYDYAHWLSDEELRDPALRAVVEADKLGNDQPIQDFIKSGRPISKLAKSWFEDWYERHKPGQRGAKAIPSYARSRQDANYERVKERANELWRLANDPAIRAVIEAYQTGNDEPILRFINTGEKPSGIGQLWIDVWYERDKRGAKGIPTYADALSVKALVGQAGKRKILAKEARWQAALEDEIDPNKFEKWYQGRRGSSRRMQQRRRAPRQRRR